MSSNEPIELGRRIVVWGVTGSGKTSLARLLGSKRNLGVVELDAIRHANGWDSTDNDDFRAVLTQHLEAHTQGWVTDGSYHTIMDVYLSRADTLVWLHLPWRVAFWRLFRRTIARAIDQKPLYNENGPHESWQQTFLSRKSILWWSIHHHRPANRNYRERIAALPPHVRVYELRSSREVRDFLARLASQALSRSASAC